MVSFNFHLLDAGYNVVLTHRTEAGAMLYHCITRDFPRCKVIATEEQHQQLINAMADQARVATEWTQCRRTPSGWCCCHL